MGLLCIAWGALPEAEGYLLQSIKLAPGFSFPHSNLGKLREKQGNLAEAEAYFRKAIDLQPDLAIAHTNLCGILNAQKRHEEAETAARRAITIDPESAEAWCNLGLVYSDQGGFTQALACYEKSLVLNPSSPETHLSNASLLLKTGDYNKGFVGYEYRWEGASELSRRPDTLLPQWKGEPVAPSDAILLFPEQGFGDHIQFMRYLPMLKERFQRVVFICPKSLASLAKENFKNIEIIDSTQCIDQKEFQWHCPFHSLALAFNTTLDSIPSAPYLAWPQPAPLRKRPAVGFVWKGRPSYADDRWRSVPLDIYGPLFQNTAVEWVCLQKDVTPEETAQLPLGSENAISKVQDFSDTAQIITRLDLVITIDSAIAHLAGAMGKPVWLLNRASGEWRWGWKKEASPWYPSMRIFNQTHMGEWAPVIQVVNAALSVFVHTH